TFCRRPGFRRDISSLEAQRSTGTNVFVVVRRSRGHERPCSFAFPFGSRQVSQHLLDRNPFVVGSRPGLLEGLVSRSAFLHSKPPFVRSRQAGPLKVVPFS